MAAAGIAAGSTAFGIVNKASANNTVRVGVIGTGSRGTGLTEVVNTLDNIEVVGCCDILPFRLEKGLATAGANAKSFTDYRKMLDDKSIDAIIVATHPKSHSAIAIDAIDAGKHVYCEKTMALGYDQIGTLVKKVSASNQVFQTGHQYHSSTLYSHVVKIINEGVIGEVTAFECQYNRNGDWRRPVPDPSLERAINWRMYRECSGGLTAELSSHQIDFVNWVTGATPKRIMGVGGIDYWKDGRETFDNTHLIMDYPNGVKATFTSLTINAYESYQIKVLGKKGTIVIGFAGAWLYPEKNAAEEIKTELGLVDGVSGATIPNKHRPKGYKLDVEFDKPTNDAIKEFRDSVQDGTKPLSDVYTGANVSYAVQMSLDAMINEEIVYWKDSYNFK